MMLATRKSRLSRRAFLMSATAGIALSSVPFRPAEARMSGTLAMSVSPEPNTLIAAFNTASPVTVVSGKIVEGLITYDFDLNFQPALATGWDISEDGLTIRFDLRQGVSWHDGQPFTSADVAYSIMEILKVHHPRGRNTLAAVEAVETPDPHTAVLRLTQPAPALMYALAGWEAPMIPKHVYEGTDVLNNPANNAPVGTGPFRFVSWSRGSHVILEGNPDYWAEGEPGLQRLVIRFITDPAARAAAFEAGELHLGGDGPIPVSEVQRFRDNPNFQVEERGTEMNNSLDMLHCNMRDGPLTRIEVRQALLHAIDRDLMSQIAYYGLDEVLTGPIPQTLPHLYTADVPAYPFDPARARALLDEAGFAPGANGIRFALKLVGPSIGDTYDRLGQFLKQQYLDVGIDLQLHFLDVASFIRMVFADYDFDLTLYPGSVTADPTIGLQRFWWSKSASPGTPFVNVTGYASDEMDRILEAASVEPNPAARRDLFHAFQRLAMEDLPILPLARPIYVTIAAANVRNFVTTPEGVRASHGSLHFAG